MGCIFEDHGLCWLTTLGGMERKVKTMTCSYTVRNVWGNGESIEVKSTELGAYLMVKEQVPFWTC